MKIRSGFISNSSSSSFIVTIRNMKKTELYDWLYGEFAYSYFDYKDMLDTIKERVKSTENNEYARNEFPEEFIPLLEKYITRNGNGDGWNEAREKLMDIMLKCYYDITLTEKLNDLILDSWISMRNSFSDYQPIIKDIALKLLMDFSEYRIKVEEDDTEGRF